MANTHILRPQFHFGPAVDDYLASEGSIAQAVDAETILFDSSLMFCSAQQRQIILLHELAHIQQLARPGCDPTRFLEEEAWEAAYAWRDGKSYRVRGRASKPLNALAIIQGGNREHPAAAPWYTSNPVEPIGNGSTITVKETTILKDITLESVMDAILKKKEKEVLVVCHGWADELAIPLTAGSSLGTNTENVGRLAADRAFKQGDLNTPVIRDENLFSSLSEDQIKKLRSKMNQIRDLKLDHLAFRSCDLAKDSTGLLEALRNLFGAASISAPRLKDTYGQISALIKKDLNSWAKWKWQREGFRVWIDGKVAFALKPGKDSSKYTFLARAVDKSSFAAWAKVHVTHAPAPTLVYHGMMAPIGARADEPGIHFILDKAFTDNIVNFAG